MDATHGDLSQAIARLEETIRRVADVLTNGDAARIPQAISAAVVPMPHSAPPRELRQEAATGKTSPTIPDRTTAAAPLDWDTRWGDVKAIRELLERSISNAASPRREIEQDRERSSGPLQPIVDLASRTRVGRIARSAFERVKPFLPTRKTSTGASRSAESARRLPRPPKPDPARIRREDAYRKKAASQNQPPFEPNVNTGAKAAPGAAATGATSAATASRVAPVAAGAGASAGGGAAAGGGALAAAGGPVGIGVGVTVAATLALVELAKAGRDAAYAQEQYARELAQSSPSQAGQLAILDAERTIRRFEMGESTSGSSQALVDSINRFEQATQPLERVLTNLGNTIGSGFLDGITNLVELMNPLIRILEAILEKFNITAKQDDGPNPIFGDFLARVAEEQRQKRENARHAIDRMRRFGKF